tara:strand:+ start:21864 stop:22685 length:822 start_codon:yes stop_codon:yes gene_type:complete
MAINISDVSTTTVSSGTTIASATENSNNNNLKNKFNDDVLPALNDLNLADVTGSSGDATTESLFQDYICGCYVYRVDGTHIGVSAGKIVINSKTRVNTSITSSTFSAPDNGDWLDVWALADATATTFTVSIADAGTTAGSSSNPGANGRLLGSIQYVDGTTTISSFINIRADHVEGWVWAVGGDAPSLSLSIDWGVTLNDISNALMYATPIGLTASGAPSHPQDSIGTSSNIVNSRFTAATTSGGTVDSRMEGGATHLSSRYYSYYWRLSGQF